MVTCNCNPSGLGGGDHEDYGLKSAWTKTKKLARPHLTNKGGMMTHAYIPSYPRGQRLVGGW
jgi:hypothetical protein